MLGVVGPVLLAGAVLGPTPMAAEASPLVVSAGYAVAGDEAEIPVLDQAISAPVAGISSPSMVVTLHAVRRVEGGTAIYYSLTGASRTGPRTLYGFGDYAMMPRVVGGEFGVAALVDTDAMKAYLSLPGGEGSTSPLGSNVRSGGLEADSSDAKALVIVAAPLPEDVKSVDVLVAGTVFQAAPVTDGGPLQPMADDDVATLLGEMWPRVDEGAAQRMSKAVGGKAVVPVAFPVADSAATTRVSADQTNVDLRSDVLFAFDKADLTTKARAEIKKAADEITAQGVTSGTVEVLGYTDSQGDHSRNVELSQQRADAVAAELKKLVPSGVALKAVGKAEADPVADNSKEEGRALNRRVTVVIPKCK